MYQWSSWRVSSVSCFVTPPSRKMQQTTQCFESPVPSTPGLRKHGQTMQSSWPHCLHLSTLSKSWLGRGALTTAVELYNWKAAQTNPGQSSWNYQCPPLRTEISHLPLSPAAVPFGTPPGPAPWLRPSRRPRPRPPRRAAPRGAALPPRAAAALGPPRVAAPGATIAAARARAAGTVSYEAKGAKLGAKIWTSIEFTIPFLWGTW